MKSLFEEVEQAWVRLTRNKTLTFVKIILLAVGLGCCIAVFTIYNSILLRPLPHANADRIVYIGQQDEAQIRRLTWANHYVYSEVKESIPELDLVGYSTFNNGTIEANDYEENLYGLSVTAEFFEILGDKPLLGDVITRENTLNGSKRLVLIGYQLWERAFKKSSDIFKNIESKLKSAKK